MDYDIFIKNLNYLNGLEKNFEALKYLQDHLMELSQEDYKSNYYNIMHLKAIYLCNLEQYDESLDIIEDLVNQNVLCGPWLLKKFPNNETERFKIIQEKNNKLLIEARNKTSVVTRVFLPSDYSSIQRYPLFIALHGGGENIEDCIRDFKPEFFTSRGYITLYIQSSQVSKHNGYNWNDEDIVNCDVKFSYDLTKSQYSIDEDQVIVGGFCGGGLAALAVTMYNSIPLKGFIALSPHDEVLSFTKENVINAKNRGVKGIFMEGEYLIPQADEQRMMSLCDEVGLIYLFIINKNIGVSVPLDIDNKLEISLKFINEHSS